jgi:transcription initiation factor TFIIIB Brf1 subunit/transcription initiation factor TFIIB
MQGSNENKKHKRLSVEELRQCKGFENISDEDAEKTIQTLETLSILFYQLHMQHKHQQQKFVVLKNSNEDEQRIAA